MRERTGGEAIRRRLRFAGAEALRQRSVARDKQAADHRQQWQRQTHGDPTMLGQLMIGVAAAFVAIPPLNRQRLRQQNTVAQLSPLVPIFEPRTGRSR